MRNEFTAIIEQDGEWYIAYCPEIPGANGQGRTIEECRKNLADAITLILEDRREDALRGAPEDAIRETVLVQWNAALCWDTCVSMVATSKEKAQSIRYGPTQGQETLKQSLGTLKYLINWPRRSDADYQYPRFEKMFRPLNPLWDQVCSG
jgi:predicted RNase H-like HicB family nuclease